MNIDVKVTEQGLIPLYDSDLDEKKKLRLGEVYRAKIYQPRNLAFHRKFFALVNLGAENTKLDMPQEAYRGYVTMKAGFFDTFHTDKGTMILPKSIAFDKMDDIEFQEVYKRVREVISKDIGATNEEIDKELQNFY